jgi:hypothetical protein
VDGSAAPEHGIDPAESGLSERVRSLQILRMLELLADEALVPGSVRPIVADRLHTMLSRIAHHKSAS